MAWRHYEMRGTGETLVLDETGLPVPASYTSGLILTDRTDAFTGYFVKLTLKTGIEFWGEHRRSLRLALKSLASNLDTVALRLRCSGVDPRWHESPLSMDSGWGYFDFYPEAIHMFAPVPQPVLLDDDLDRQITEAVEEMRFNFQVAGMSKK